MRVALLHNPRPAVLPAGAPPDAFEEFDPEETIDSIRMALSEIGLHVVPVIADRGLPRSLEDGRFDFVFNIAEGRGRRNREAVPAAVCELLEIPYTGSDVLTLAVTLDKWVARRVVSPEVPVAPAVLLQGPRDRGDLDGLKYPAIVKPNDEGSSKGIRPDSLVESARDAAACADRLYRVYGCPVLVEEFLAGPEITAAVLGNGDSAFVLALMEIEPVSRDGPFLYSLEVKRDFARQVRYHVPPRLPRPALEDLERMSLEVFHRLGCRDVARIDFRLDGGGRPFFLECNPLPGLNPMTSDIVILSRGILPYRRLVQRILTEAALRTGTSMP
jgi:D-alanine-D-alanine ligase